jgi:hypothetical protein
MKTFSKAFVDIFWMKVKKSNDCWLWTAAKTDKGYGVLGYLNDNGKNITDKAHRISWRLHYGEIPDGLCVLHKCDVSGCVNPKHLFLGTKSDNNRDMFKKKRNRSGGSKTPVHLCKYKRGINHHMYRINKDTITQIKRSRAVGLSYPCLSRKYNISIGHVWRLCNGLARVTG